MLHLKASEVGSIYRNNIDKRHVPNKRIMPKLPNEGQTGSQKDPSRELLLDAAALQDHYARSLKLTMFPSTRNTQFAEMKKKPPRYLPPMQKTDIRTRVADTPMSALEIIRQYKQEAKVSVAQGPQTGRETTQIQQNSRSARPNDQSWSDPQQLDYKAIIGKEGSKLEREGAQQKHADYQNYVKKLTLAD